MARNALDFNKMEEAKNRAIRETAEITPFHYTEKEDGSRILLVLETQKGRAECRVEMTPEGTVHLWSDGETLNPPVNLKRTHMGESTRETLEVLIARKMQRPFPPMMEDIVRRGQVREFLNTSSLEVLWQKMGPSVMPSRYRQPEPNPEIPADLQKTAAHIVRNRMMSRDMEKLAVQVFRMPRTEIDLETYNHTVLNREVFAELLRTNRVAMKFYGVFLWNQKQLKESEREARTAHKMAHSGEVIREVKDFLSQDGDEMPSGEWREFLRTKIRWWEKLYGQVGSYIVPHIRATCQVLHEANQPTSRMRARKFVVRLSHISWELRDTPPEWPQWVRIVNRFTDPDDPGPKPEWMLHNVAEAMTETLDEGRAWGPGTWQELANRANRWTEELLQRATNQHPANQQKFAQDMKRNWESLLGETTVNGVTFKPINNGQQLSDAANRMANCLTSYVNGCVSGEDRIFIVSGKGSDLNAVQIHRAEQGHWTLAQTEGTNRRRVPKRVRAAAGELARLYGEAETRQAEGQDPERRDPEEKAA